MDFDVAVKMSVYETVAAAARLPTAEQVAGALGALVAEVRAAFERLHRQRLLVPEPGDPSRLRMAPAPRECAIHFTVPAARWWVDILYT